MSSIKRGRDIPTTQTPATGTSTTSNKKSTQNGVDSDSNKQVKKQKVDNNNNNSNNQNNQNKDNQNSNNQNNNQKKKKTTNALINSDKWVNVDINSHLSSLNAGGFLGLEEIDPRGFKKMVKGVSHEKEIYDPDSATPGNKMKYKTRVHEQEVAKKIADKSRFEIVSAEDSQLFTQMNGRKDERVNRTKKTVSDSQNHRNQKKENKDKKREEKYQKNNPELADDPERAWVEKELRRQKFYENLKEQRKIKEQQRRDSKYQPILSTEEQAKINLGKWVKFNMDPLLMRGLRALGYETPSEIQSKVIPVALQQQSDIIGAAETGSGKTLSFGIPILHAILRNLRSKKQEVERKIKLAQVIKKNEELRTQTSMDSYSVTEEEEQNLKEKENEEAKKFEFNGYEEESNQKEYDAAEQDCTTQEQFEITEEGEKEKLIEKKLMALILCPTRELSIQVANHIRSVSIFTNIRTITITGGMAPAKQTRELNQRPEIVVATPGRLWELISEGHPYLSDLSNLLCFAIDEADHMIETGHFKELESIIEKLPQYKSLKDQQLEQELKEQENENEDEDVDEDDLVDNEDEEQEGEGEDVDNEEVEGEEVEEEVDEEEIDEEMEELEQDGEEEEGEEIIDLDDKIKEFESQSDSVSKYTAIKRQTFIFSATLVGIHAPGETVEKKDKFGEKHNVKIATPLQKLLNKVPFHREHKLIDCTFDKKTAKTLSESKIYCALEDKDLYLYYFIDRYPGRTLVFVNSIDCIKRLTPLLHLLEVPVFPLHAQMEQRQRLRNLDNFRKLEKVVLLATDVAARGLDIPLVQHVIHYQVPRTIELYVHRSGRTARSNREGISVLIVDPQEIKLYEQIEKNLPHEIDFFPADQRYLPEIRSRIDLALMIENQEFKARRDNGKKGWFIKAAQEIDMEIGDEYDVKESERERDDRLREQSKLKAMKQQLHMVLKQPLVANISGKYQNSLNEHYIKKTATATQDLINKSNSKPNNNNQKNNQNNNRNNKRGGFKR